MSRPTPWEALACAAALLIAAFWYRLANPVPADTTPLTAVAGTVTQVATNLVGHRARSSRWWRHTSRYTQVVTLTLESGQTIRYSGGQRGQAPGARPMSALPLRTAIQARVDADGEIWELSAAGQPEVRMADTLAQIHGERSSRNLFFGLFVVGALAAAAWAWVRLQAGKSGKERGPV